MTEADVEPTVKHKKSERKKKQERETTVYWS